MNLAPYIDHTFLKPSGTELDIQKLCEEALEYRFAAVCVHPTWVPKAVFSLAESGVLVASVVGFPSGAHPTPIKRAEAEWAAGNGVAEIDMVMNLGWAKEGWWNKVQNDVEAVVQSVPGVSVKVILECCDLTNEEIVTASKVCEAAGAHWVKTSTGFGSHGAKLEHVKLMRQVVSPQVRVKASGGIRSLEDAKAMIAAGAERLGTSSGVKLVQPCTT